MNKFFNKALMYQYYYSGKWPLAFGLMFFAFIAYYDLKTNLYIVNNMISSFHSNMIEGGSALLFLSSWFVLFGIYFAITGLNKKSVMEFLQSGPFSKEDIKKNQIITLIISLLSMTIIYVYMFLCITYKSQDLIGLIPNYYAVFGINLVKFLICGMAFISYLVLMDILFSNVILEIIMIVLTPFLTIFSVTFIESIYYSIINRNFPKESIFTKISEFERCVYDYVFASNYYEEYLPYSRNEIIIAILILTVLFFIISWYLNKNFTMNKTNKLFNFKGAEVISEYLFIFNIVALVSYILIKVLAYEKLNNIGNSLRMFIFVAVLTSCIVITEILRKILSKSLKKYL